MTKRILCIFVSVFVLMGCASAAEAPYTVGICQIVTHEAVEEAARGFMDALDEALGKGNVIYDSQTASGDVNMCATIINAFVADEVDLILANGTPVLQAAAASTGDIPILGTSVTEYGVALGMDDFQGTVGGNISGTSDLAPLDQQAQMIPELFPNAQKVGLLYCSAEANSQYQVNTVKAILENLGLEATLYPFTDSNDLAAVAQVACEQSDVLYTPTDNTVAANATILDNLCQPMGVPVVAGEAGICAVCGVATLSISYYDLGVLTGRMAARVLTGEADISAMPIAYVQNVTRLYNPCICDALGITVPDTYLPLAAE